MEVSLLSHFTNSLLVVQAIKWLRGTERYQAFAQWLPMAEGKVHVLMSLLGAAGTALGMHGAVTGTYSAGWSVTLAIPPLWVVLHAVWDVAQQFAANQFTFAIIAQQKAAAPVVTAPVQGAPALKVTVPLQDVGKVGS